MKSPDIMCGTPYSMPDTSRSLSELSDRMQGVREQFTSAVGRAQEMGLMQEIKRAQDYWSVFESNRIEFEGPDDLKGTVEAITSATGQDVLRDLNMSLLPEVLRKDRRAYAAIGLEGPASSH